MRIDEFRNHKNLSQEAFGALLSPPASQSLVSQWENGVTKITLDRALEIEDMSGGLITARECQQMFRRPA